MRIETKLTKIIFQFYFSFPIYVIWKTFLQINTKMYHKAPQDHTRPNRTKSFAAFTSHLHDNNITFTSHLHHIKITFTLSLLAYNTIYKSNKKNKQQYITAGTVSLFIEQMASTYNCFRMLSTIFKCQDMQHTISAYSKCQKVIK